ncbi:MAG: pacearchaeosortase [Candidatus Pacearchaeota archaeon]
MKFSDESKKILEIFSRYFFLIIVSLNSLFIFYLIFTPLTVIPVFVIMSLFFETKIFGDIILVDGIAIEFIKACIAGSAYFLLLILNLATPGISLQKRIKIVLVSFVALLTINIIRIVVLIFILFEGASLFILAHEFFWYSMSTVFVVVIWFAQVKYFKIKEIPFYSDLKYLFKHSRKRSSKK